MGEVKAFGIESSSRRFHLRLARYMGLCDAIREFRQREASSASSPQTLRLLDVGAGHGRTLMYLKAHGLDEHIEFYGVDNAEERRNRLFEPHRWDYRLLDVEQGLPFENGFFDIVVCEQVLEHLKRPNFAVAEISRVLRPGGLAILGVPNFPPGFDLVRRHVVPRIDRVLGINRDHEQVFTQARFTRLIEENGELRVRRVQAFRCVSGGLLKRLEHYEWWYKFSRTVATAVSPLAIEIQTIADRLPMIAGTAPPKHGANRHTRPILTNPFFAISALCIVALMTVGWMLNDVTHANIFSDATGMIRPFTASAWMIAALGIAYCLRSRLGTAIAFAGTALAAGALEGRFFNWLTGMTSPELISAMMYGTTGSPKRLLLLLLALSIMVCAVAALWMVWQHLRTRGGLHQTWVQLMGIALGLLFLSEIADYSASLIHSSAGAGLIRAVLALEEGVEFVLPGITLLACIMLATALGKPVSEPRNKLA